MDGLGRGRNEGWGGPQDDVYDVNLDEDCAAKALKPEWKNGGTTNIYIYIYNIYIYIYINIYIHTYKNE